MKIDRHGFSLLYLQKIMGVVVFASRILSLLFEFHVILFLAITKAAAVFLNTQIFYYQIYSRGFWSYNI